MPKMGRTTQAFFVPLKPSELQIPVSKYKGPELRFHALLIDVTQEVRFERVVATSVEGAMTEQEVEDVSIVH